MIHTILIKVIAAAPGPQGMTTLILDDHQKDTLIADLKSLSTNDEDQALMAKMRTFFFHEEGYMANDSICQSYWWEHNEQD